MSQTCSTNRLNILPLTIDLEAFHVDSSRSTFTVSHKHSKIRIISIGLATKLHWIGGIGSIMERNVQQTVSHFVFDHKFNFEHLLLELTVKYVCRYTLKKLVFQQLHRRIIRLPSISIAPNWIFVTEYALRTPHTCQIKEQFDFHSNPSLLIPTHSLVRLSCIGSDSVQFVFNVIDVDTFTLIVKYYPMQTR